MRSSRAWIVGLGFALCLANLGFTFARSAIPLRLEGTIESIDFLTEDNPGIDDIYVLRLAGDDIHIDKALALQLTPNVHVSKRAWSSYLTVGRFSSSRTIELTPSEDFMGMAVAMPVVMLVLVTLVSKRARS